MLTIGQLANVSKVKVDTLRYYERTDLLMPISRSQAGYRLYDQESVNRVRFIKKAQSLGFSLKEISQLLKFDGSDEATAGDVLAITEQKIFHQDEKIKELKKIEDILKSLTEKCSGKGSAHDCPILRYLYPSS